MQQELCRRWGYNDEQDRHGPRNVSGLEKKCTISEDNIWSENPLLKLERLSDSLCCLGRKGRDEIAVKNNGIITLLYY